MNSDRKSKLPGGFKAYVDFMEFQEVSGKAWNMGVRVFKRENEVLSTVCILYLKIFI